MQLLFSLPDNNNALLLPSLGCSYVGGSGLLFDVQKRAPVGKCETPKEYGMKTAISPDGKYFAHEAKTDHVSSIEVVTCQTGVKKHTLRYTEEKSRRVIELLCDNHGRLIGLVRQATGNGVFVWNLEDGKLVKQFTVDGTIGDRQASLDDAGQRLAIVTTSKLRVYDFVQGKELADLAAPSGMGTSNFIYLREPAFSPDAQEIAGIVPSRAAVVSG